MEENGNIPADIRRTVAQRLASLGFRPMSVEGDTALYTPNGEDWTEIQGQSRDRRNAHRDRVSVKSIRVAYSQDAVDFLTDGTYLPFRCSKPRSPWDGSFPLDMSVLDEEVFARLRYALRGTSVVIAG